MTTSLTSHDAPDPLPLDSAPVKPSGRPHMSRRNRALFFLVAWLIVLMPFLFWWNTWFGRHLSDTQLTEFLHDNQRPRHIQHALVQLGERIERHDAAAAHWYPDVAALASHPVEEVRNTDAWIMGLDTTYAPFHATLLTMLNDSSTMVRGNAALSLVRFGDATGRAQIVALLQPAKIVAPQAGRVVDLDPPGTAVRAGGIVIKFDAGGSAATTDVRSPITGRIRAMNVVKGTALVAGADIATIDPGVEQTWDALRALYVVGTAEDLAIVRACERESPDVPDRVRQQAVLTEKAITQRATRQP